MRIDTGLAVTSLACLAVPSGGVADLIAGVESMWLDSTDLSTQRQLYVPDTAPVIGQPIGLHLDKSQGLALGAELIVNGNFAAGTTGWTATAGMGLANVANELELTRNGASQYGSQSFTTVVGRLYKLTFRYRNGSTTGVANVGTAIGGTTNLQSATLSSATTADYSAYFLATATTTHLSFALTANGTFYVDDVSVRHIAGNHGLQTGSARPYLQAGPSQLYDRFDDNFLTPFHTAGGPFSFVAKILVPPSLSADQFLIASNDAGSNRNYLGVAAAGVVAGGLGAQNTATIRGTTDLRNLTGVIALIYDGVTVKLYWNGQLEYSGAKIGVPNSIAVRVGCLNSNGTPTSFWGSSIIQALATRKAFTLAELLQIIQFWS